MLKKPVLSFLAVVIHAVSKHGKVDVAFLPRLHQKQVVLVMSMGIHKCHHALKKHIGLRFVELAQDRSVHLVNKISHDLVHPVLRDGSQVGFGKFRLASEILLVHRLIVLIHGSETSSQKEEVELLDLLVLYYGWAYNSINRLLIDSSDCDSGVRLFLPNQFISLFILGLFILLDRVPCHHRQLLVLALLLIPTFGLSLIKLTFFSVTEQSWIGLIFWSGRFFKWRLTPIFFHFWSELDFLCIGALIDTFMLLFLHDDLGEVLHVLFARLVRWSHF